MIVATDLSQAVTYSGSSALHQLGGIYFDVDTSKVYRYVVAAAACTNDTLAANEAICYDTGGEYIVNNDMADGTGIGTIPAGVAIGDIAEGYYGWIQVGGKAYTVGDGSVAQKEYVVPDIGVDGQVDTMAAGEEAQVMGWALENDAPAVHIILRGLY